MSQLNTPRSRSRSIEQQFVLAEDEGSDKVVALDEAVRRHVRPGMTLFAEIEAEAMFRSILRQFHDMRASLDLVAFTIAGSQIAGLIHAGIIRKLVFTNCSDFYPAPRPSAAVRRAIQSQSLQLENWSVLSLELALLAGALGLGFMPTKALVGSDTAEANKGSFKVVDDPFGSGERVGIVKAISPDLALVHGWAADRYGNTITNSWASNFSCWGAKASREGVLVTVEQLVSTEFIRQHAHMVRIPGYHVKAVSVVPFGGHPQPMPNPRLAEFEGYGLDTEFCARFQEACRESETLDAWIREWVLDIPTQEEYLAKLGADRLSALKDKNSHNRQFHTLPLGDQAAAPAAANRLETMVVVAARKISALVLANDYKTVFPGIGFSGLAGWVAYYMLQKAGYLIDLVGAGIGFAPLPGDPYLLNPANVGTSKMLCGLLDMHGNCVSGENNRCLGVIGAGQIDRFGNVNSSWVADDVFLSGLGGGNDIATGCCEVVALVVQSTRRLLDRVTFLSHPGGRIRTLVTDLGVFEKPPGEDEFVLSEFFPVAALATPEEHARAVQDRCGWQIRVADTIVPVTPPTPEELALLRSLDPQGDFIGET